MRRTTPLLRKTTCRLPGRLWRLPKCSTSALQTPAHRSWQVGAPLMHTSNDNNRDVVHGAACHDRTVSLRVFHACLPCMCAMCNHGTTTSRRWGKTDTLHHACTPQTSTCGWVTSRLKTARWKRPFVSMTPALPTRTASSPLTRGPGPRSASTRPLRCRCLKSHLKRFGPFRCAVTVPGGVWDVGATPLVMRRPCDAAPLVMPSVCRRRGPFWKHTLTASRQSCRSRPLRPASRSMPRYIHTALS